MCTNPSIVSPKNKLFDEKTLSKGRMAKGFHMMASLCNSNSTLRYSSKRLCKSNSRTNENIISDSLSSSKAVLEKKITQLDEKFKMDARIKKCSTNFCANSNSKIFVNDLLASNAMPSLQNNAVNDNQSINALITNSKKKRKLTHIENESILSNNAYNSICADNINIKNCEKKLHCLTNVSNCSSLCNELKESNNANYSACINNLNICLSNDNPKEHASLSSSANLNEQHSSSDVKLSDHVQLSSSAGASSFCLNNEPNSEEPLKIESNHVCTTSNACLNAINIVPHSAVLAQYSCTDSLSISNSCENDVLLSCSKYISPNIQDSMISLANTKDYDYMTSIVNTKDNVSMTSVVNTKDYDSVTSVVNESSNDLNLTNDCTKYKCNHCERSFNKAVSLALHMRKHNRSNQVNQCNICNKIFASAVGLALHRNIHLSESKKRIKQLSGSSPKLSKASKTLTSKSYIKNSMKTCNTDNHTKHQFAGKNGSKKSNKNTKVTNEKCTKNSLTFFSKGMNSQLRKKAYFSDKVRDKKSCCNCKQCNSCLFKPSKIMKQKSKKIYTLNDQTAHKNLSKTQCCLKSKVACLKLRKQNAKMSCKSLQNSKLDKKVKLLYKKKPKHDDKTLAREQKKCKRKYDGKHLVHEEKHRVVKCDGKRQVEKCAKTVVTCQSNLCNLNDSDCSQNNLCNLNGKDSSQSSCSTKLDCKKLLNREKAVHDLHQKKDRKSVAKKHKVISTILEDGNTPIKQSNDLNANDYHLTDKIRSNVFKTKAINDKENDVCLNDTPFLIQLETVNEENRHHLPTTNQLTSVSQNQSILLQVMQQTQQIPLQPCFLTQSVQSIPVLQDIIQPTSPLHSDALSKKITSSFPQQINPIAWNSVVGVSSQKSLESEAQLSLQAAMLETTTTQYCAETDSCLADINILNDF